MWRVCLFVFNHHFPRASDHPLTSGLLALCEQEDTTEITLSAYTHGFGGNVRMTLSLQVLLAGGSGGVPPGFLGYCPQESALWPGLTVREHLEVSAAVKGLQRADAAAAITRCVAGHHLLPTWAETPSHRMRRADSSILVDRLDPSSVFLLSLSLERKRPRVIIY